MTTRDRTTETTELTPLSTPQTDIPAPDSREPLADARVRPLLERYVAAAGAELIDISDGLVELRIPRSDRRAFHDREQIRIAFTLDALERDPEAEIAVVGSPLVEQLVTAIRTRGSRAFYGRLSPDLARDAEAATLQVPIANATAGVPTVDAARHRIVRLLARVVVRAGSAVEEHLLESGFFDATTGVAIPEDVGNRCLETIPNDDEDGMAANATDAPVAASRRSAELVSLALADLRGSLEPRVKQLRADAQRALEAELHRIDGYYASLLSDSGTRNGDAPDDAAKRLIEAEHARRRGEEERRHQVRAVVHPVQLSEWELLVQRARWELTTAKGVRAPLVAERWLNGNGSWVLACPECGTANPQSFSVCKSGHVACDRCASSCGVCADVFCQEHGIAACHVDEQPICADHALICSSCQEPYCTAHEARCAEGGHTACCTCVTPCAACNRGVCDEHAMMSSSSSPRGPRRLCMQCLEYCEGGTNERVGIDEVAQCSSCEKYVCEHHRSTCAVDHQVHCSKHLRRTDGSRRLVCEIHRAECALDPGSIHGSDEVGACAACGRVACDRHSHVCVEDGQRYCDKDAVMLRKEPGVFACRNHHSICHVDQGAFRLGQTSDCPICRKTACKAHVRNCGWCGRDVCITDVDAGSGRCRTCRALRQTAEPTDNVLTAAAGLLGGRSNPKRWKVARDGAHTVVEVDLGWTRHVVFVVPHGDTVASGGRSHSAVGSRGLATRR